MLAAARGTTATSCSTTKRPWGKGRKSQEMGTGQRIMNANPTTVGARTVCAGPSARREVYFANPWFSFFLRNRVRDNSCGSRNSNRSSGSRTTRSRSNKRKNGQRKQQWKQQQQRRPEGEPSQQQQQRAAQTRGQRGQLSEPREVPGHDATTHTSLTADQSVQQNRERGERGGRKTRTRLAKAGAQARRCSERPTWPGEAKSSILS